MNKEDIKIGGVYYLKPGIIFDMLSGGPVKVLEIDENKTWPLSVKLTNGEYCPVEYNELEELTDDLKIKCL